jgi:hypothetical protein
MDTSPAVGKPAGHPPLDPETPLLRGDLGIGPFDVGQSVRHRGASPGGLRRQPSQLDAAPIASSDIGAEVQVGRGRHRFALRG